MAFSGQVLCNPVSGERFVFHTTADDSAGELLEFDLVVEPHGRVPGGHVHPGQQESFEVRAGIVKFRKGLRTVTAGPGDHVVVPPGTFHRFANAGDEPAVIRVRVEPALRMEQLFETVTALAAAGRTLPSGLPRPLDLALFMREFEQEVQAPVAPGLVRAVLTPLASVAERRGLGQRYHTLRTRPAVRGPALMAGPGAGRPSGTRPGPSRPARSRPAGPGATARQRPAGRRGQTGSTSAVTERCRAMWYYHPGGWGPGGWIWIAWMILFWGGLLVAAVYFIRHRRAAPAATGSAEMFLAERYARGGTFTGTTRWLASAC